MNNSPVHASTLMPSDIGDAAYDLVIAALGFESRAITISAVICKRAKFRLALGFDHNQTLAYEKNKAWFISNSFTIFPDLSAIEFGATIKREIINCVESSSHAKNPKVHFRVAVDISCFDRQRLAEIVCELKRVASLFPLAVDYLYCIAKFEQPTPSVGRNEVAGPIHRKFAGHFADPGFPLVMIAGLGYEVGKVMGAAEYVQASRVIALIPESPLPDYEPEVRKANKLLLNELEPRDQIRYPVSDPNRSMAILDSIVRGLKDTHNIVLLPGGPKIFVLTCLLIQLLHPQTSVWRVSSGSSIKPKDVQSSGVILGIRLHLGLLNS